MTTSLERQRGAAEAALACLLAYWRESHGGDDAYACDMIAGVNIAREMWTTAATMIKAMAMRGEGKTADEIGAHLGVEAAQVEDFIADTTDLKDEPLVDIYANVLWDWFQADAVGEN